MSRVKAVNSPGSSCCGIPKRRRRCLTPTFVTQDGASRWNSFASFVARSIDGEEVMGEVDRLGAGKHAGDEIVEYLQR